MTPRPPVRFLSSKIYVLSPAMNSNTLRYYLDNPEAACDWLRRLGVVDAQRAYANVLRLATSGMTLYLAA